MLLEVTRNSTLKCTFWRQPCNKKPVEMTCNKFYAHGILWPAGRCNIYGNRSWKRYGVPFSVMVTPPGSRPNCHSPVSLFFFI